MAHTIISSQTAAVSTVQSIRVSHVPATLFATGLAGAEECDLYISPDAGATWEVLDKDSSPVTLTAVNSSYSIQSPMLLGVKKDATSAASGIYLSDEINI